MKFANYSTVAQKTGVEPALGIIRGVSVITLGNAQGHNMRIDDKTLDQVLSVAQSHRDGVKVKFGRDHAAGVEDTIGVLREFRKDGEQIRADLYLLKTCTRFAQILEMAEKMPNEFGLSAVFSGSHEEIEKVKFARCSEIYSVDLVSDPAANPNGLFSAKKDDTAPEDKVEYEADGKAHKKSCMCMSCKKEKMSDPKKNMSELLTPEVIAALSKELGLNKLTELSQSVTALEKSRNDAIELAKKSEIAGLIAEAGRDGKFIPLSEEQLAKLSVADVKEVITKLPKSQIPLTRGFTPTPPKNEKGEEFDRNTSAGREATRRFCLAKQNENAAALGAEFKRMNATQLNN